MTRAQIACLMYHEITDDATTSGFQRSSARRYGHTRDAFHRHLERIASGPLVPEAVTGLDWQGARPHLLLTFDDGGKSAAYVAEELALRGWPAHFFIVTARIGDRTFLSPAEIRDIHNWGHVVGSHSHTHPDIFRSLPRAEMLTEWCTSRAILEDLLGTTCVAASIPGGDLSRAAIETAQETGFRYLFTSEPWLTPRRHGDCFVLGRLCLKTRAAPATVEALVHLHGWRNALLARRVKELVRRGMGPLYHAYVRVVTRPSRPESPGVRRLHETP